MFVGRFYQDFSASQSARSTLMKFLITIVFVRCLCFHSKKKFYPENCIEPHWATFENILPAQNKQSWNTGPSSLALLSVPYWIRSQIPSLSAEQCALWRLYHLKHYSPGSLLILNHKLQFSPQNLQAPSAKSMWLKTRCCFKYVIYALAPKPAAHDRTGGRVLI